MRCRRCGSIIKDGEPLCAVCRYPIDSAGLSLGIDNCTLCGRQVPHESAFCLYCGTPRRFTENVYPGFHMPRQGIIHASEPRPSHRTAAAIIAAVLAVALLLAAALDKPSAPVVYIKHNQLVAADLYSLKTAELSSGLSASDDEFMLNYYTFCSPDGRYLYYPERDGDAAAVYRRDLSVGPQDPHAVVRIDRGIGYPLNVTPDNKAVYIKEPDGCLYVNNGEAKRRIARGVSYFELSEDGTKLVYTGLDGSIGYADLMRLTTKKIVSNATLLDVSHDFSAVYYDKNGGFYEHRIGGTMHRIASNISGFVALMDDGTVYYTKSKSQTVGLADILEDDMEASDSAMQPPDITDYQTRQPAEAGGTTLHEVITDESAYTAALASYAEKLRRDDVRAIADTFEMDFNLDTLYAYQNGKETKAADDFAYTLAASGHGLLIYKKAVFAPPKKIKLSSVGDIDRLYALFGSFQYESGGVYACINGTETLIVSADADSLATDNSFVYVPGSGSLYYLTNWDAAHSCGTLQMLTVNDSGFSAPQTIDQGVGTFAAQARTGTIFYLKSMHDGCGEMYKNGVKIDSGVSPLGMLQSKDGDTLYYYKDISDNGGTLMAYAKGDTKRIASAVYAAALISDRLVFIGSAGGLYLYTRGKPCLIDNDVTRLIDTQKNCQQPGLNFLSPELLDAE